jgi:hypothetical protein
VFTAASAGLALIFELSAPVGLSTSSGHDGLQSLYDPVTDRDRASKVAFVVAAGGDL